MSGKEKQLGKVEIKVGNISFTGEGDQEWLGEQISKVIDSASQVPVSAPTSAGAQTAAPGDAASASNFTTSLASYLKDKGGETKQVQRFLTTAAWLEQRGQKKLNSTAVTKALSDNHQKRLGNSADNLNQNVTKGYCEKQKNGGFFITPEGWKQLGEER